MKKISTEITQDDLFFSEHCIYELASSVMKICTLIPNGFSNEKIHGKIELSTVKQVKHKKKIIFFKYFD